MEAALWPTLADAAQVLETRGGPRRPRPDAVPYACTRHAIPYAWLIASRIVRFAFPGPLVGPPADAPSGRTGSSGVIRRREPALGLATAWTKTYRRGGDPPSQSALPE